MSSPAPSEPPAASPPGSVFRALVRLAWPVVALNTLTVTALAVDTAMVGRIPEAESALTGLGFATQIAFVLMVAMMGVTVGSVAFVARAHGAGDRGRVDHVVAQSATLAVLLGLTVALVGNLVAAPVLRLLGASGPDLDQGLAYLRPLLAFSAFSYLNILLAAVLRGVGNTLLPLLVALGSNVLNFLFNYALILGSWGFPRLGVQGAAIGTGLSQAAAVAVLTLLLARGAEPRLHVTPRFARPDFAHLRDLLRVGSPAAADMLIMNVSFLSIIGMLGAIDPLAVAAHGMGLRVQSLAFVPGMSIAQAMGALVGQALGAGDPARARRVLRDGAVLCVLVTGALAAAILAGAPGLVRLFDVDPAGALGTYALQWMHLLGWCMPVAGLHIAYVGLFQGAGATQLSLKINALCTLAFQVPASALLGFGLGMGVWGVWVAFPLSFVGRALLAAWYYRAGTWEKVGARV